MGTNLSFTCAYRRRAAELSSPVGSLLKFVYNLCLGELCFSSDPLTLHQVYSLKKLLILYLGEEAFVPQFGKNKYYNQRNMILDHILCRYHIILI